MLLSNRFMSCHGVNAVPLSLINMVCVGGFQFDKLRINRALRARDTSCPKGRKMGKDLENLELNELHSIISCSSYRIRS